MGQAARTANNLLELISEHCPSNPYKVPIYIHNIVKEWVILGICLASVRAFLTQHICVGWGRNAPV